MRLRSENWLQLLHQQSAVLSHAEGKSADAAEYLQRAKQWRLEKRPNDEELKGFESETVDFIPLEPAQSQATNE